MLGTLVNTLAVLLGGGLGLLLGGGVPKRLQTTIMQGVGLCVIVVGLRGALTTEDVLGMIICMVVGGLIGEGINIELRLEGVGVKAQRLLMRGGETGTFVQGFMAASLLFCVGPMSIVGPLESGLSGNHGTQIAKALMDGTAAVFMAATLGPGVLLSALMVLVYQGTITLSASLVAPLLTDPIIREMSAVGGAVILGIGLNLLEVAKVRVGNLLPALFLPIGYVPLAEWIARVIG